MGKLIILSGPSCIGKSPLDKALKKFFPELRNSWQSLVLYNSRDPRPGETDGEDYHFRTRGEIESLKQDERYVVMEVRGDLQALDVLELIEDLDKGDIFFEGNPFVGEILINNPRLEEIEKVSVFISPLSVDEIQYFKTLKVDLEKLVTDIMRRKLLRRTRRQKTELALSDLENIEIRAKSAFAELHHAGHFDFVIPNYDGEDSENWDAFYYPIGNARKTLLTFTEIVRGNQPTFADRWPLDLL